MQISNFVWLARINIELVHTSVFDVCLRIINDMMIKQTYTVDLSFLHTHRLNK